MAFELLAHLSHATLPLEFNEFEQINTLVALNAAGLVIAKVPAVIRTREGLRYNGVAVVTAVTSEGISVLRKRTKHPSSKGG